MKILLLIHISLCLALAPLKAEWRLEPATDIYGKVIPNVGKRNVWHSPPSVELPKELQAARPLEAQGPLPILKISKKQLEAEGYIHPLEDFMKVKERSQLDLKAMRRSLLHNALTNAKMDEVATGPIQMDSTHVSQPAFSEHYGGMWSERKMYQWLVHDILVIEYLQKRPEKFWKTGALIGANTLQTVIRQEDIGKLQDTGFIGFAVTELYVIPYYQNAIPEACREYTYKTSDILIGIYALYNKLKLPSKCYVPFFEKVIELEKPYQPAPRNFHLQALAEIYEKEGALDKAIKALEQWDTRDDQTSPLNADVKKKLEALKKTQTKNTITTCSIAAL